jgi:hypothetical protein
LRHVILAEITEPDALAGRALDLAGWIAALYPQAERLAQTFERGGVADETIVGYRREPAAIRDIRRGSRS